ncbi:methylmalonyl-CoA epimerase [Agrobacterium sp. NPDC090273]|uniref:methylmalonyl-CoA epimerase n=1 Tax=Agrobacterium sp. NPDC090273 TaxID=3363919 RepID=UPI00383B9382
MLERLNHIAIAVPDLESAIASYKRLGCTVSSPQTLPEHGVTVVFIELENTKIELLHPFGPSSPITSFLEKNPAGGIHHFCLEVSNIEQASEATRNSGVRVLGDGTPKIGAHGNRVVFLHPKDMNGALVELEETGLH